MESETINIILGLIGLSGTIFGVWSYFRMKEEREPQCYYVNYIDIIKYSPSRNRNRLKVYFDNQEVDEVFTTYLFFWNSGRRPIRREDIPTPLKISYIGENAQILDFTVLKVSTVVLHF